MRALRLRFPLVLIVLSSLLAGPWIPAAPVTDAALDPALLAQLEQGEEATFVVLLREQADLAPAYAIRDWDARGQFVLDALRATAGRTQPAVLAALNTLQAAGHVARVQPYYIVNAIVVRGDGAAARFLAGRPGVAAVLPEPLIVPIAPVAAPTGAAPEVVEWNIQRVQADDVWATYGVTGAGIVVANIDSGVEYAHPALVGHYRGNLGGGNFDHDYNWWDPTGMYPAPQPISGPYPLGSSHGTATMGVLVGDDGGVNQIGVAPGAQWIAAYGFSGISGLLSATEWTIAPWRVDDLDPSHPTADPGKRPHIVSNSWGAPGALLFLEPLLQAQRAAGIFNAFAAGNNGEYGCGTMASPADNPAGFAVGATDQTDGIAFFSSRGPNGTRPWLDTYGIGPEVTAPGYPIRTSSPGGGYYYSGGTSFATPHVAGTAALLWSAEPDLIGRVEETAAILRGTAAPKTAGESCGGVPGSHVPNNTYGWGRLDALAAVAFAWHAGTLAGAGAPAGADVLMQRAGHAVRTTADAAGAFDFPLGAGSYTVTMSAYGYAPWTQAGVVVTQDMTTTLNVSLAALPAYTLAGTVVEEGRQQALVTLPPLAPADPLSALLGLRDTPVLASTDPATGAYAAPAAAGAYALRTTARGYEPAEQTISVTGDLTVNVALAPRWTYYLRDSRSVCGPAFDWIDATDGTPYFLGFMDFARIDDPAHPFPFYGVPKSSYFVGSLGFVGFSAGHPDPTRQDTPTMVIPFEGPPNDVVYAFLDILNPAHGGQGTVYHKVVDDRYVVIEFHRVQHWVSGFPETFEFIFDTATGIVTTQYLTVSLPTWTTVGLENADGSDGLLYSYENSAGLANERAVAFYPVWGPPPADQEPGGVYGTLSGTVYLSGTTIPVPGAVVTATSHLHVLTTTVGPAGQYLFPGVCADLYTVQAGAVGCRPGAPAFARLRWAGDTAVHALYLEALQPAPALTKTVWPAQVPYGELLTYTLAVANHGDGPLVGVLSDTLPLAVGYMTSTPPGVYHDGTVTWTVDLPAGGSGALTILAYLIPPPAGPLTTTVTNTACLFWAGPTLSASAAFAVLPLPGPAPVLTKTVGPAEVLPGGLLTYTVMLANAGPGGMWGAVLTDTLPVEVAYITSTPPGLYADGTLTWYADLPAGGRLDVAIVGQLTTTAVPGSMVPNTAYLLWLGPLLSSTAVLEVAAPCQGVSGPSFAWTPLRPLVGQEVVFTATVAAGDPPLAYDWALDVGSWPTGPVVTHTYTLPGTYTVVLTATNCGGSGVAVAREAVVVQSVRCAVYLPLVFRGQ